MVAGGELAYHLYLLLHSRSVLVWLAWGLLALILLLVAVMVIHKLLLERRERRLTRLKSAYLYHCLQYLANPSYQIPLPRKANEWQVLADVIIYLYRDTTKERVTSLRSLAVSLGVSRHLLPQLKAHVWKKRLAAVERLGLLRLQENRVPFREQLVAEKDQAVVMKLLWAISLVAGPNDVGPMMSQLIKLPVISSKFNEHLFRNLIVSFGENSHDDVLEATICRLLASQHLPMMYKRDLIEACGVSRYQAAGPIVREFYEQNRNDSACRIAALRSAGQLASDQEGAMILPALQDPDWRVRAVAARAAVHTCSAQAPLASLLGDPNYYVRMNAAKTLASMGTGGRLHLQQGLESQDRFVRDVSRFMLGEG